MQGLHICALQLCGFCQILIAAHHHSALLHGQSQRHWHLAYACAGVRA